MEDYNDTYKENPWYDKNVKQVIIADGVTTIGKDAFKECTKLTSINIPNSVTAIGYMAFYRCEALKVYKYSKWRHNYWISNFL